MVVNDLLLMGGERHVVLSLYANGVILCYALKGVEIDRSVVLMNH